MCKKFVTLQLVPGTAAVRCRC